jgi:hypothetical protein
MAHAAVHGIPHLAVGNRNNEGRRTSHVLIDPVTEEAIAGPAGNPTAGTEKA